MKMEYFDNKELKKDNHLNLQLKEKVEHYMILIIPIMIIFVPFSWFFNKEKVSIIMLILILLLGILLLYSFYTLQREKLLFKLIKLEMPDNQLKLLIHNTLTSLKWDFYQPNDGVVFASTGNFFTLELKITIIYENSFLYINILDNWGYITTFGKTTRYYKKFRDQIFKEYQQYKSISSY